MPIQFKVVERGNPLKPESPKKFYANNVSSGEIKLRELAKRIAARSTVSSADVTAVLESLIEVVPEEIAEGKIVRLGDFGSFSTTVQSEGMAKANDVNAASIKKLNLKFRPGKVISQALSTVQYEKVKD